MWVRQHLLLGILRVLLFGEWLQLLPGEHRDGWVVAGRQLFLLRGPAVLHGLQRNLFL
jgi:hypothetical protein